MAHLG